VVVKDLKEIKKLKPSGNIGLISQTTQSIAEFKKISRYLRKKSRQVAVYDTICRTTSRRQKETSDISGKVDVMLIVGGKNSANTKRLAEISQKNVRTYHIETAKELKKTWFEGADVVGISAGASTPDWLINETVRKIRGMEDFYG